MALIEVKMPQMGESVLEATVIKWLKAEGEHIEEEEPLLEVATDKVDTEVPSIYQGVIKELLVKEGDVVQIGNPIAIINTNGEAVVERPVKKDEPKAEIQEVKTEPVKKAEPVIADAPKNGKQPEKVIDFSGTNRFYSPLVRNIAAKEQIPQSELDKLSGTGKDGRVTKNDILSYLNNREAESSKYDFMSQQIYNEKGVVSGYYSNGQSDEDEIIQMDRVRKIIADRMVESRKISAHVHSFVEADVTNIVKWRSRVKDHFQKDLGVKLTFTPIFIEALAKALIDYPMMNISVDGDKIIKKKNINIGIAVALPDGNLIVPVIKKAQHLSLIEFAKQVNDLALKARNNQLSIQEISGSTYTITNVGSFGSTMGTPIILQPNVGILAIGAIEKKPSVIETEEYGDVIAIRQKMTLSHSYDHRVVDGALGSMFVRRVADYLESFDMDREV